MAGVSMSPITDAKVALQALAQRGERILVGPWLGEVGFEVLYWIPFLRWAIRVGGFTPDQLLIVSRGGCESWYQGLSPHYVDIFDHFTPADYIARNEQRVVDQTLRGKSLGFRLGQRIGKQYALSDFDEAIRDAVQPVGEPRLPFLHPSVMFLIFRAFWRGVTGQDPYRSCTRIKRLQPPPRPEGLPTRYVAMKWYVSNACPYRTKTHEGIVQIVEQMTRYTDVVLLHTGTRYDDHGEFAIPADPRVHTVSMDPRTNLATQTAVIGGASHYVGTYGGFAYLAPFLTVPTLGIYTDENFRRGHLSLMQSVAILQTQTAFDVRRLDQAIEQRWGAYAA